MIDESTPKEPKRLLNDYVGMGHSLAGNHLRTQKSQYKHKPKFNLLGQYLSTVVWGWVYYYLKSRFGFKATYTSYTGANNGVFEIAPASGTDKIILGIAGDWATDTKECVEIADGIRSFHPDITIHIGDTYFVGAPPEIKSNFLGDKPLWHHGKNGSLALLGNHEMYAQGKSFFKDLLPVLNVRDKFGERRDQQAAYFCLETDHWRILGLDTGYNSIGIPVLELTSWFPPSCRFPKKMMDWLRTIDFSDNKGVMVFTHHQYISAFNENEFIKPAKQLAKVLGEEREIVWIWGHEHKFAAYNKFKIKGGIMAAGRCIGNGGTPVEVKGPTFKEKKLNYGYDNLLVFDKRTRTKLNGIELGYNGFAIITIEANELNVSYRDNKQEILKEKWITTPDGKLQGSINYIMEGLTKKQE